MAGYLIHAANIVLLLSYSVRDILWLRILSIVAGALFIPYFLHQGLYEPIAWNGVFVAINGFHVWRLVLQRRPVQLSEREQRLYQLVFRSLRPHEFVKLLDLATWRDCAAHETLVEQGTRLDEMMLIYSGRVGVDVDGERVTELDAGSFIGEMSFLTGEATTAAIKVTESASCVAWPMEPLRQFLRENPGLRAAWQFVIGTDLAAKLKTS